MKIKEELIKACGERVGELFANTQGAVNPSELRAKMSFSEIVEIHPKVFTNSFNSIREHCEKENLENAVEFMDSLKDFISKTYDKHASLALIEENYGNTQYKSLIKEKAVDVYGSDKKNFNNEAVRQIRENPPVSVFFKEKVMHSQDATTVQSDELKEKIALLAQVGIMNCMLKKFKFLREKPVSQFETFFNEDSGSMTNSIMMEIQHSGII